MSIDQITPTAPVGPSRSPEAGSLHAGSIQTGSQQFGGADALGAYYPEPSTTGIGTFHDVLGAVRDVAAGFSKEVGGVSLEATGGFAELIEAQIQAQMEMQTTSLISNIERSKHESKMAAIRNVRMS